MKRPREESSTDEEESSELKKLKQDSSASAEEVTHPSLIKKLLEEASTSSESRPEVTTASTADWSLISTEVFQQQICCFLNTSDLFSKIAVLNKGHYQMIFSPETWLAAKVYLNEKEYSKMLKNNLWEQCQFKKVSILYLGNAQSSVNQLADVGNMIDLELRCHSELYLSSFKQLLKQNAHSLQRLTFLFLQLWERRSEEDKFSIEQPLSELTYLRVSSMRVRFSISYTPLHRPLHCIVQNVPKLKVLILSKDSPTTRLDDEFANILWNTCPLLEKLLLNNITTIEDSFFSQMHNCKHLKTLEIFLCPKLTVKLANHINHANILGSLEDLSIRSDYPRSLKHGGKFTSVDRVTLFKESDQSGFRKLKSLYVDTLMYDMFISNNLLPPNQQLYRSGYHQFGPMFSGQTPFSF